MTYFDINGKDNILDQIVVTKIETLISLLTTINKYNGISQSDLRKESKFSLGKIYPAVKALKAMKAVDNGNGIKINEDGKKLILSYSSDKKQFKELLKNSFLNVPLFSKIYEKNKNENNPKVLFRIFKKELEEKYKDLDDHIIGSGVRRYLVGIYDIQLKAGMGVYVKDKSTKLKIKKSLKNKDTDEIIESVRNFKKNLNLSQDELLQIIDSLPNEKKKEIFSKVFSKIF